MRLILLLLVALPGCTFSPDLGDGTLACGTDRSCPPGYSCGTDGHCYRAMAAGVDAASAHDAAAEDASPPLDLTPRPDLTCWANNKGGNGCGGN